MSFIPSGPYVATLAVLILIFSTALWWSGSKSRRHIAAALLISLLFARIGTVAGNPLFGAAGMAISAIVVIGGRTVACLVIAAMYAVRIMLAGAPIVGFFSISVMAELTNFILILQLVVACGGFFGGHVDASTRIIGVRRANGLVYIAQVLEKRVAL